MLEQRGADGSCRPIANPGKHQSSAGTSSAIALNPGNEASSFSVANVNIADTAGAQEPLDASLDLLRRWAFASDNPPVLTVSFQGQGKGTQLLRKSMNYSKNRARPGINQDRTRRRLHIEPDI